MSDLIMQGKICPYCGEPTKFVDSSVIYGRSYGMIYLCEKCRAYVGVHPGTDKALGRLANAELREAKKEAHSYFDMLWKTPLINDIYPTFFPNMSNRNKAYLWLSEKMGIRPEICHIGMFNVEKCKQAIEICKQAIQTSQTK